MRSSFTALLVSALILVSLTYTVCYTRTKECFNTLVIENNEFRAKVRNFTFTGAEDIGERDVLIYIRPGEYMSRLEKKRLRDSLNAESSYHMLVDRYGVDLYLLKITSMLQNDTSTTISSLIAPRNESLVFHNYSFVLETGDYRKFLAYNLSLQYEILELNVTSSSIITDESSGRWYIRLNINRAEIDVEKIIEKEQSILFPLKPLIVDPMWLGLLSNFVLEKLNYNYANIGVYEYSIVEIHGPYVSVPISEKSYAIDLMTREIVLSRTDYVRLDAVNISARSDMNSSVTVSLEIWGRGKGDSREVVIKNILYNFVYLSKTYGCFKLETKGIRVVINGSALTHIDENLVLTNIGIEEIGERGSNTLAITALTVALVISVLFAGLIIKTRYSGSRAKHSKHT